MISLNSVTSFLKDIIGNRYVILEKTATGDKVVMEFDVIEEANFRASSTVTSYPTETGIMRTDYKYQNPSVLDLKAIIARKSILGAALLKVLSKADAMSKMNTQLEYYKSGMYALTIHTRFGVRENYTLESYEIPEDFDTYGLFTVNMTFRQIPKMGMSVKRPDNLKDTISGGLCRILGLN